jgi:hypothetical protein
LEPENKRPSQKGLARQLQVSRQYIAKVVKQVWPNPPFDVLEHPVTIAELKGARERRKFYIHALCPTFDTQDAEAQADYHELSVGEIGVPQYARPQSEPQHSKHSIYTAPRTYREWEQEGLVDGPRRNHRPVRRIPFRVPF